MERRKPQTEERGKSIKRTFKGGRADWEGRKEYKEDVQWRKIRLGSEERERKMKGN